jgi:hypothetical protein
LVLSASRGWSWKLAAPGKRRDDAERLLFRSLGQLQAGRLSAEWSLWFIRIQDQSAGKAVVNMRFDARLLARIDAAARRQGISRTAWLHVAASRALEA